MQLIDGKKIASEIFVELTEKIARFPRTIGLAFLLVGDHPASKSYVQMKKNACAKIGIRSLVRELSKDLSQEELLAEIDLLNQDPSIDGILVQLPLPKQIDTQTIARAIDPEKDVDGFHPLNMGKLLLGDEDGFIPCTPRGILLLLERSKINVEGKHVVIAGRSNIVGKPLAALLVQKKTGCNATVTIVHRCSENFLEITQQAELLVAAIGVPQFIRGEMVKQGAVVIDVGINRVGKKIVGDVDFDSVAPKASFLTPVPGGVGPMTIALLMQNTVEGAFRRGA